MRLMSICGLLPALLMSVPSFASDSAYKATLATESLLLDITSTPDGLVAVGERGHILSSNDGVQWSQQDVPTTATLTAVAYRGDKGWAVGHDATILHQSSSGAPWQIQMQNPDLEKPLLDVYFKDKMQGIAIGAYGIFYRTSDGGQQWVSEAHPELLHPDDRAYLDEIRAEDEEFYQQELASIMPHLNRLSAAGDKLYLAGESGLLAYSEDFGQSWHRMDIDYLGSFFDIEESKQGRLIAAGLRGNIFEYSFEQESWAKIPVTTRSSFNSILMLNDGKTLLLGNNGYQVTLSADGVIESQADDGQALINAIDFKGKLIAVSATGIKQLQ